MLKGWWRSTQALSRRNLDMNFRGHKNLQLSYKYLLYHLRRKRTVYYSSKGNKSVQNLHADLDLHNQNHLITLWHTIDHWPQKLTWVYRLLHRIFFVPIQPRVITKALYSTTDNCAYSGLFEFRTQPVIQDRICSVRNLLSSPGFQPMTTTYWQRHLATAADDF